MSIMSGKWTLETLPLPGEFMPKARRAAHYKSGQQESASGENWRLGVGHSPYGHKS
jgi:hypothetical protein